MSAYHCNHCGNELRNAAAGMRVLCPVCNKVAEIPLAGSVLPPPIPPPVPRYQLAGEVPPPPPGPSTAKRIFLACTAGIGIFLVVGLLGWGGITLQEKRQAAKQADEKALEGMKSDMDKLVTQINDDDRGLKKIDLQFETDGKEPKTDGERARRLMQSFFNEMINFQNSYLAELQEAGLSTLLDANRLAKDKSGEESRKILARLTDLVTEYEKKHLLLIHELPKRADGVGFGVIARAQFIAEVQNSTKESVALAKQIWALEMSVMKDYEELLEFLVAKRQSWTVEDNQIMFDNDSDVERFNEILERVEKTAEKQKEIQLGAQKKATNRLNSVQP